MIQWLRELIRLRPYIDLDAVSPDPELDVFDPSSGRKTPGGNIRKLIALILRQTIEDQAVAVQFFYDFEDKCLRLVRYLRLETDLSSFEAWEMAPAPGYCARQVFEELRRQSGRESPEAPVLLTYWYLGTTRRAELEWAGDTEARVYFSSDRPPMRSKGVTTGGG